MTDTPADTSSSTEGQGIGWLIWPGLVVALLAGQVLMCFVAISLAVGDPSAAILPEYYEGPRQVIREQDEGLMTNGEPVDSVDR